MTFLCRRNALILSVILTFIWVVILPSRICAEQATFTVTPLLLEITGAPGSKNQFTLEITNESVSDEVELETTVVSLKQEASGRYISDPSGKSTHSAASWFSIANPQFKIGPSGRYYLQGQIDIPRNYQGGAYAGIVIESVPSKNQTTPTDGPTASLGIKYRFMVIVEITVTGRLQKIMHVRELRVSSAKDPEMGAIAQRYGQNVLRFSAVVENAGNIHAKGQGSISIRDTNGRKIREFPLGAGRGVVIPGGQVEFASILPAGLPAGTYSLQAVIRYGGSRPAILRQSITVGESKIENGGVALSPRLLVEPDRLEFLQKPGSLRTALVRIQNLESEPVVVNTSVLPLVFGMDGEVEPSPLESTSTAPTWAIARPAEIRLAPGDRRNIQVVIQPPRDMTGGGYAQVVFTGRFDRDQQDERNGTVEAAQLFINSGVGIMNSMEIVQLEMALSPDNSQIAARLVLRNTGNIHTGVSAQSIISRYDKTLSISPNQEDIGDMTKVKVQQVYFPALNNPVLPGEARELTLLLNGPFQPGNYVLETVVTSSGATPVIKSIEFNVPTALLSKDVLPQQADDASSASTK